MVCPCEIAALGKVVKKASEADANGNVTRLVYDGFDRLQYMYYPSPSVTHTAAPCGATAETWCGGTAPYTARVVNTVGKPPLGVASTTDYEMFGYNANGSKTSWRRRNGQTKYYGYDRLNRVVHENGSTGPNVYISYDLQSHVCDNIPGSDTASSGDDCTDRMTAVTTAGIHNRYDKAGRLLATKDANGRSLAYGYDEVGRRTSLTYPDSVIQGYQYNVDGSLKWSGVSATTVGLTLAYDTRGRLTSLTRSNGVNSTIGYDDLSRPLSLKHTVTNAVYNADWAFVYNPASQVRKVTAPQTYDYLETAATVSTPTYDGLNRDTGIANQTTTCGNATDGYDCNGNLTYEGTGGRTFTYDIDNRLLTATGGSAALTLSYDAVGRLSSYTAGSTTTQFLYDGPNLIAEYQGGVLVKRYMHTTGVDQPFMEFTGTGTAAANANFPLANYQGSIIAVSDSTGNVSAANVYKYSPYGEPTNGADAVTWAGERFRYTGQIALPEARLYYYKARVYDPVYGRFLQTDPIGSKDDLDLYAYVGVDPVNRLDPSGTSGCTRDSDGNDHCNYGSLQSGTTNMAFKSPHKPASYGQNSSGLQRAYAFGHGQPFTADGQEFNVAPDVDIGQQMQTNIRKGGALAEAFWKSYNSGLKPVPFSFKFAHNANWFGPAHLLGRFTITVTGTITANMDYSYSYKGTGAFDWGDYSWKMDNPKSLGGQIAIFIGSWAPNSQDYGSGEDGGWAVMPNWVGTPMPLDSSRDFDVEGEGSAF